jgi:hypothetical protein
MELSAKAYDALGAVATVGTGVLAWMYESTKKNYSSGQGTLQGRLATAVGNTLGAPVQSALFGTKYPMGALKPSFWGWANKAVGAGILLGIADYVAGEFIPAYSKDLDGFRNVVQGTAIGLTVGGAIGGIFDPAPVPAATPSMQNQPQVQSGSGAPEGYASLVVAHNMRAVG